MKVQYGVQMFRCGKWVTGMDSAACIAPYDTLESAKSRMETAKEWWQMYHSHLLGTPDEDCFPSDWRIVKRQISEWEPI